MLVRVLEFKFETQDVSDVTHSDPSGIGHVGSSKKLKEASPYGLGKICAAPARGLPDFWSIRIGHDNQNTWSRSAGMTGHDKPESPVTIDRNTHWLMF